jgi:hypothetical protein
MRNPSNAFMLQFSSNSYRAPTTERPQQGHKRDNLKRDQGLAAAFVADFIE